MKCKKCGCPGRAAPLAIPPYMNGPLSVTASYWRYSERTISGNGTRQVVNPDPARWGLGFLFSDIVVGPLRLMPMPNPPSGVTFGLLIGASGWLDNFTFGPLVQSEWWMSNADGLTFGVMELLATQSGA